MDSSIISYFRKINNIHDTMTKKEVDLYNVKKHIIYDFDDRLLSFLVEIESEERYIIITDSPKDNTKKIVSKPNEPIVTGDVIVWDSVHWIALDIDPNKDIYCYGEIKECFSSIKWLDSTGEIREAWFTYRSDTPSNFGIQDGRVMMMPNERRHIIVQSNEHTQEIRKDRRFIFDNRLWRCISIEGLVTGIITLTLEEDLVSNANDRMDLRIADYTNNIHTYSISIVNGSEANVNTGDTLQLSVEVKDNGVVSSLPITYTSSDVTIATVDSNGLVATLINGDVTITAKITSHPTDLTSILLSVSSIVVDNFTVNVRGADECKVTRSQSYISTVSNNAVVDNTKSVVWSLLADNGIDSTSLATIDSQTGIGCTIKANNVSPYQYGYVRLIATMVGSPSVTQVKRIHIRSLF